MPPRGPFPRVYEIEHAPHARKRSGQRDVPKEMIEEAVRTGGETPLPRAFAPHGGLHVKFTKGSVVVIAEIAGNVCYVVTTYHADRYSRN
jgi:hypothetical protein